jgi:hypothetical protein
MEAELEAEGGAKRDGGEKKVKVLFSFFLHSTISCVFLFLKVGIFSSTTQLRI